MITSAKLFPFPARGLAMIHRSRFFRVMLPFSLLLVGVGTVVAQEERALPWLTENILAGAVMRPAELLANPHVKSVLEKTALQDLLLTEARPLEERMGIQVG